MYISTSLKRIFSCFLALIIIISSFTLVFADEGVESDDAGSAPTEESAPVEESTPSEESAPAEESAPIEESTPSEESTPAEESKPEDAPIDSFDALKAAIKAQQTKITLSGVIEFSEAISIPEVSFEINGGELINASFSGLGHITFKSTKLSGSLTTSSRAMIKVEGNAPSITANDSSSIIVTKNIKTDGDGIAANGNSSITVSGNIDAGGVGIIANGGTITVNGSITSGSDGVQFTKLSSVKKIGSITAGSGVMYRDMSGEGGTFPKYSLGETITFIGGGEMKLLLDGAVYTIRATAEGETSQFKVVNDIISFPNYDTTDFKLFISFTFISTNCKADIKYTNEHRVGASSRLIKTDGTETTELSAERYNGSFEATAVENQTVALFLTTKQHTVTILQSKNGTLSCGSTTTYLEGELVEFSAKPDDMYIVDVLTIGGESFPMKDNKYYYPIMSDVEATATFKLERKTFTVEFRQTIGGTVSRKGKVTVSEGDSLTFTMEPDDGYYLSMIEINKELMERSETYTIENITEDLIVFITFKQSKTYSIILKHTAGGTVTADDTDVYYGGSTKIRITPNAGYVVDKVIADFGTLTATSDPNIYRLKSITVDTTVTVSFKKIDGDTPPPAPVEMLKVSDVSWDYHPIRLELFEYTVISEEVIEKLRSDYPDVEFTIVGEGFNWNFSAGDAEHFPEGNIDFGILIGKSEFEENHIAFSGGSHYVSISVPEGVPTVGELKVFAGRAFVGLPFYSFSFDGNEYKMISEGYCDAYFELTVPLGHREIFMLCNGKPANTVTVTIEGNGTVSPNATQYVKDGSSVKFIFEPDASSYLSKITVNGSPAYYSGHVLLIENVTEDLSIVCVFLPHESNDISRYQLPIIENRAEIIVYVFAFVGFGCYLLYIILRRTGKIKYKKEL